MKKLLLAISTMIVATFATSKLIAQTTGTLTFVFTEASHPTSATYNGNAQHDLAVWIQTSAGAFVKTKLRYVGSGTNDHLPTWATQASCTGGSATSAGCNTLDGTTGATRTAWSTYTVTWDGKKGAAATGTLQADGVYKVAIQSTWDHGTAGTATSTFTFTKGPNVDHQTPANTANFTGITINWQPSTVTGIDESIATNPEISVYPNPTNGVINVDYSNAKTIRVINALGTLIYEEKIEQLSQGTKSIDLNNFANGIYMITVSNENGSSNHKVILNK
ncbi:MAG: T9SS type A sorting domain-containing protein [Bacteroidetes bacterium]|nr:T9SS type A sorting domain-containing protein [Bacteroidota bacterium]